MNEHSKETMRRAAEAGRGALEGMKEVHDKAQLVSRVPRIGKLLGLGLYAAGAIRGAASTLNNKR